MSLVVTLDALMAQREMKVTVLVYNYDGVSGETLARAERETSRIYARAAIEIEWLQCPLALDEEAQYPACHVPLTSTWLALRVFSRKMAERDGLADAALGTALFPEGSGFAMTALVCAPCTEELAKGDKAKQASVLGAAMAHELGHLLLGAGSHSATGVMHVPWQKKELESVAQGRLLFTSREGDNMRRQLLARETAGPGSR